LNLHYEVKEWSHLKQVPALWMLRKG
jgi:hypothetical protein